MSAQEQPTNLKYDQTDTAAPERTIAFMASVAEDVLPYVATESRAELTEALPVAAGLLAKLAVPEAHSDPANAHAWEKGVLLLPIAHSWMAAETPGARRQAASQLACLYTPEEGRSYRMVEPSRPHGVPDQATRLLLTKAWPESNGDLGWVSDHVAEDHVATLPFDEKDVIPVMDAIYTQLGVPEDQRVYFAGFGSRDHRAFVTFQGASQHTLNHERSHFERPGLCEGMLRVSLDEGMTEWETLLAEEDDPMRIGPLRLMFGQPYADEIYFLQKLSAQKPHILELLRARYNDDSLEQSKHTTLALIQEFGPAGYLQLSLMAPKVQPGNAAGYATGYAVATALLPD